MGIGGNDNNTFITAVGGCAALDILDVLDSGYEGRGNPLIKRPGSARAAGSGPDDVAEPQAVEASVGITQPAGVGRDAVGPFVGPLGVARREAGGGVRVGVAAEPEDLSVRPD